LRAGKPVDRPTRKTKSASGRPTIREIVDAFLSHIQSERKPETYRWYLLYALRHTYATDSLIAGLNTLTVAERMGHSSTKMLEAVYQKIRKRQDFMKEAARKAVEGL